MRQSTTSADSPAVCWRRLALMALALTLLTSALVSPAGAGAPTAAGDGWVKQSAGSRSLYAVAFTDALHGWAVGNWGAILATVGGGATWSAQRSGSDQALTGVAFADGRRGWAVGWNGTILATASGGLPPAPTTPSIAKLKPASGKRGASVTITGVRFNARQGSGSVRFGAAKCTRYVSWTATTIKCRVPATAKYGTLKVAVTTTAGVSNTKNFTVKR